MGWMTAALVLTAFVAMVIGLVVNRVWIALLPLAAWAGYAVIAGDAAFANSATRTLTVIGAAALALFLLAGVWVRRMKPETARRVSRMRTYW